jgi:selenide, water dikinase
MGGRPLTALNIVAFPAKSDPDILKNILLGGADKIHEAGAVIVGGHSIKDPELKYGIAVTGIIDIDKIISNDKARPGDILILTKPLGTGIVATAIKNLKASDEDVKNLSVLMARLNRVASELMIKYSAHAATDITGFGLLGHGYEIASGSDVSMEIQFDSIPIIDNALEFAAQNLLTGGAKANETYLKDKIRVERDLTRPQIDILYDAQTSGGLLISLPEDQAEPFLAEAGKVNLTAVSIGKVIEKQSSTIVII